MRVKAIVTARFKIRSSVGVKIGPDPDLDPEPEPDPTFTLHICIHAVPTHIHAAYVVNITKLATLIISPDDTTSICRRLASVALHAGCSCAGHWYKCRSIKFKLQSHRFTRASTNFSSSTPVIVFGVDPDFIISVILMYVITVFSQVYDGGSAHALSLCIRPSIRITVHQHRPRPDRKTTVHYPLTLTNKNVYV